MDSLLLDYNNIIKPNQLPLFTQHIAPKPITTHHLGLILILPALTLQNLKDLPSGHERIEYIGSAEMVQSIVAWVYVIYDSKGKLCEILEPPEEYMGLVLGALETSLPNDITICVKANLTQIDLIEEYINVGFGYPYICQSNNICMSKQNNTLPPQSPSGVASEIAYTLSQVSQPDCSAILQLEPPTLKYLKTLTTVGSTLNDSGSITQKEVAGALRVTMTTSELVHMLEVVPESIIAGEEEGVPIANGLYNFHSHPKAAYERHRVELAWPSAQDYVGFLLAVREDHTICHLVISIEGIYIISLSTQFDVIVDENIVKFIKDKYDIYYNSGDTSLGYIHKINNLFYNRTPIFDCQYLSWVEAGTPFTVNFGRRDSNCNCSPSPIRHPRHEG